MANVTLQDQSSPAKPVGQLRTGGDLDQFLQTLKNGRQVRERQWRMNLAFYKGRQYVFYSRTLQRLQTLPTEDGDKPRYRVRITSNQIIPGCASLLSKYLKTKPRMMATPGTGSDQDLRAAEMAETLLEYWWEDLKLDDALEESMLWTLIGGQGWWKIWWDDAAGKSMNFIVNPNDGQPIMDENLKKIFLNQLAQMKIDPAQVTQTVYMGDICVETVSPFDVYVDPTVRRFKDAKYVVQRVYLTPDEIQLRYKRDVTADAVPGGEDLAMPFGTADRQTAQTKVVKEVWIGYFKPSATLPQGRIVTFADKDIYEDKKWDLPTNDLPFIKFPGLRVPGEVYDEALVTHAIPLQKELNRTLSQIVEYKNLAVKPQWMAPAGSLRTRRTDEPGAIFEYNPVNGFKPEPIQVQNIPSSMFQHVVEIQGRIDTLFGKTEVTEGAVPPNVEAGIAIDLLQEMATDRFAPTIRLMEVALEEAGHQMLTLAQTYYTEPRLMKIRGISGGSQIQEFTQADIKGNVQVQVETGSALPRTRAGRQARIESFIQQGIIRPDQAWRYIDMGDLHGIADQFQADEDQAYREHELLDTAQPISMLAVQKEQQEVQQAQQQGVNPDTGQPFQSPQEFQQWAQSEMEEAMVTGAMTDNHDVHIDVHSRVIKGFAFRSLPLQVQKAYSDHVAWHIQTKFSLPTTAQPQGVRTSLQLRGAVTPDEVSAILGRNGVQVTPEQAAEPPTETWVASQVTPGHNTDGSPQQNADPALEQLLQSQIDMNEGDAKNSVSHAQTAASIADSQQAQAINASQAQQQMAHAQQLHEQKMAHAEAKHQASLKAAAKPNQPGKGRRQ